MAEMLNAIQRHTLVSVHPTTGKRWQVIVEGRARAAQFSDRERALSYAQIWAAVNRPSTVVVYSASGATQEEWRFAGAARFAL